MDEAVNRLNENGLIIDIYPDARKSYDIFSNLKSANFQPYVMAAQYARENKLNDCLVLNSYNRIADSTIANLFLIKNEIIITPSLDEGCIDGVMRKYLVNSIKSDGADVKETTVSEKDILNADEIFLTNAIHGIKWVSHFRSNKYGSKKTTELYNRYINKQIL